jgi:hypothetical protein
MTTRIEMHVRYRGNERFLRLVEHGGKWHAALLTPGQEDTILQECPSCAPRGAALPKADLDDMTFRIESPSGEVINFAAGRLVASGVPVRDGWIEVPLRSIMRNYRDCEGDPVPDQEAAEILSFPQKGKPRMVEPDMER